MKEDAYGPYIILVHAHIVDFLLILRRNGPSATNVYHIVHPQHPTLSHIPLIICPSTLPRYRYWLPLHTPAHYIHQPPMTFRHARW